MEVNMAVAHIAWSCAGAALSIACVQSQPLTLDDTDTDTGIEETSSMGIEAPSSGGSSSCDGDGEFGGEESGSGGQGDESEGDESEGTTGPDPSESWCTLDGAQLFDWSIEPGNYSSFADIGPYCPSTIFHCTIGPDAWSVNQLEFAAALDCDDGQSTHPMSMTLSPAPQVLIDAVDQNRAVVIDWLQGLRSSAPPGESCVRWSEWLVIRDAQSYELLVGLTHHMAVNYNFLDVFAPLIVNLESHCDVALHEYDCREWGGEGKDEYQSYVVNVSLGGEQVSVGPGSSGSIGGYEIKVSFADRWVHITCDPFPSFPGHDSRVDLMIARELGAP
jgi:hypothetical protein